MSGEMKAEKYDPEYRKLQRDCKSKLRGFVLHSRIGRGTIYRDMRGKAYRIAEDGSHRRIIDEQK